MELTAVDPDVAAAAFAADMDALWATGRPAQRGWDRASIDPLTAIVHMPGRTAAGPAGLYHLRLHASHYGPHPPKVTFVEPNDWAEPPQGSVWLPRLENLPAWFRLHPTYDYPDGRVGQLVCFSHNLDYYAGHAPQRSEMWEQGVHTVAATLNRIYEILGPPYHRGPNPPPESQV